MTLRNFHITLIYIYIEISIDYSSIDHWIMCENLSLDLLFIDENIHRELLQLIENHSISQLDTRLNQLENSTRYLTLVKKYNQHQVTLLMLAAFLGYDDIVRVLLSHDNTPDHVELKGKVVISDQLTINGATALYCACYQGHFTVAKTLIELGHSNVDQDTNDRRFYPLFLHATIMNRRDVIDFLLENKYADINETKTFDRYKDAALMVAVFEDHTSLIEYLIAKGADVNYSSPNAGFVFFNTPVGWAVTNGHADALRLLCRAGADASIKNQVGNTLLTIAVQEKYPMIIAVLLDESINTIEDLELEACLLVSSNSGMRELSYMLSILKMAIERRLRLNIPKVLLEGIAVYDYQRECRTVEELDSIENDRHRMYKETLLIRERIALSRPKRSIVEPLEAYGITLVEREQYEKAFNWWIHTFYLYDRINLHTELAPFVWLFCVTMRENGTIPMEWFLRVARLVFEPSHLKDKYFNTLNTLFLIVIATKILEQEGLSQSDRTSIYSWVKDVCRLRLTTSDGRTLLHICVDVETNETINFRPNDIGRYLKYVWSIFTVKHQFTDDFSLDFRMHLPFN